MRCTPSLSRPGVPLLAFLLAAFRAAERLRGPRFAAPCTGTGARVSLRSRAAQGWGRVDTVDTDPDRTLTLAAELAWRLAVLEAQRARSVTLSPAHVLVGVLSLEKLLEPAAGLSPAERAAVASACGALTPALRAARVDAASLRREVRRRLPTGSAAPGAPVQRNAACRRLFEQAAVLVQQHGLEACGVLHLLAATLDEIAPATLLAGQESHGGAAAASGWPGRLVRLRAPVQRAIRRQMALPAPLDSTAAAPAPAPAVAPTRHDATQTPDAPPQQAGGPPVDVAAGAAVVGHVRGADVLPDPSATGAAPVPPILLRFGRDLTAQAEAGALQPVVGRDAELLQLVRALRRRTKSCPVLVGEAGVGKTAIVEGLAQQIAAGGVLPGRRIVALNLASVVADTSYRGEFEERLGEILTALRDRPDIVLFLDEIHTIVGAGGTSGALDAANMLKPALARGEIACIGATTTDEYQRHIAPDAALERRFQPVQVHEPTVAAAVAMLRGLCADLERHHGVTITEGALEAAVALTVRYVTGRRLPDKAVDALDEACARAATPMLGAPAADASSDGLEGVDEPGVPVVTKETVAAVVAAWTGVPLGQLDAAEAETLADLEHRLNCRVVGQPAAVAAVTQRVRLARAGLTDPDRPAGVFLFLGPSGVGKTELARALAELTGGGSDCLIRLDLGEYGEKHHTARLLGAPPGYEGHDEEGQLTGPLRRMPYAVVLLDEVEKAHPAVFDVFLHLFDAGRLTDGKGRLVDGRHATFVLTSNLLPDGAARRAVGFGAGAVTANAGAGTETRASLAANAGRDRAALLAELRTFIRPELLNRIDEIVVFRSLGAADLLEIARLRVAELGQRLLVQHGVELAVSDAALRLLAQEATANSGAARELGRQVSRLLAEPISRAVLTGRLARGTRLLADVAAGDGGAVVLIPEAAPDAP
jgi:ATP-dependent Clp protease ATP-binding subunit ClpC